MRTRPSTRMAHSTAPDTHLTIVMQHFSSNIVALDPDMNMRHTDNNA